MNHLKNIFIIVFFASTLVVNAQTQHKCSIDQEDKILMNQDPTIAIKRQAMKIAYRTYMDKLKSNPHNKVPETVYRIPVVVHIMHNYGQNAGSCYQDFLTNRQRYVDAIEEINRVYSNADSNDIEPPFNQISHKLNIEFYLANKDPQGNLTKGMTFNYDPETESATQAIKANTQWDNTKYLNIWIVNGIASGAGGWSHYPGINDSYDGIVVLNNQLSALAHECGHWLGLPHPWGSSNDNDLASNCSIDDGIDDTPNTRGQTSCNTTRNSCSDSPVPFRDIYNNVLWPTINGEIHDNTQNVMDYAFCAKENFTEGQKEYVRLTLANTSANGRNIIWNESNLIATGTCDACGPYNFPPKALFEKSVTNVCIGTPVQFTDYSYEGTSTKWHWDFGDGDTSNLQNPSHSYSTVGNFTVTLTSTNLYGSSNTSQEVVVGAIIGGLVAPLYENFESTTFPDLADPLKEWTIINGATTKWQYTSQASHSGLGSLALSLKSIASDQVYELLSPTIDFSSAPCKQLKFKYAYAKRYSTSKDKMNVYVSKNCGDTWKPKLELDALGEMPTTDTIYPNTFIPNVWDWKEVSISLSDFTGQDNILVKFEVISGNGNYLYLDDINMGCLYVDGINEMENVNVRVFPNPFENDATLDISLLKSDNITLQLYDVLGKKLYSQTTYFAQGTHQLKISELSKLDKGVYFISIFDSEKSISKKIVKY